MPFGAQAVVAYQNSLVGVHGRKSKLEVGVDQFDSGGPKVTRAAVNDAIRKIDMFDAHGLVSPASPGRKIPPTCFIVLTIKGGRYQRLDPAKGYRWEPGGSFKS